MKGLMPALFLAELERRAGRPVHELFDLVAGTSVGGIIGASLCAGKGAEETCGFFTEDGPRIFHHTAFTELHVFEAPRYRAEPLEAALQGRLGETTMAGARTRLLVVAMDLVGDPAPFFFKSYGGETSSYPMWQACRATSAAQTYFPAYRYGGHCWWDGGIVANSPAMCAYADAVKLWGDEEDYRMLSLGCGQKLELLDYEHLAEAGLLKVGAATLKLVLEGPSDAVDYQCRQVMGNGYYRVQPRLGRAVRLDDASPEAIGALRESAHACILEAGAILDAFAR